MADKKKNKHSVVKRNEKYLIKTCFLFSNLILICSLSSFATDVVNIYYDKDETVQGDEEIQAFVKDVCSFGMQDFDKCGKYLLKTK